MNKKYLIIPPCSDFNRGDQALVWETMRFSTEAGYVGDYFFMAESKEPVEQSLEHGLHVIRPILEHPSRRFKSRNNIKMNWKLIFKWGIISILDLFWSLMLLSFLRNLIIPFLSGEKKKSYALFKKANAVFVKGGGFVHSYGGISALYYIYFQLYHIFLAQTLKKDVYILPNSFGPFEGMCVKWLVKKAFRKSKFVTARESRSCLMCRKYLNINVQTYPDFGFFLPNGLENDKKGFLDFLNLPCDMKLVAITVRPHRFPKAKDPLSAYKMFCDSIRNFCSWLYERNFFPVFMEHVYAINNHENDGYCIEEVINGLDKSTFAYYKNRSLNCQELKRIYSYFDYIVGTRFHSMIFAMANRIPGIAITYVGNKGEGIMEDMLMSDYYININDVTQNTLITKFQYLLDTEETAMANIDNFMQLAWKKRIDLINQIRKQ